MNLVERIPGLSDEEVNNLLDNARRLQTEGSPKQQAAASEILPVLETTAEERRTAKLESAQEKRAAGKRLKKAAA